MIRIYGMHTPMFTKVVYAAEELSLHYEIKNVDLMKAETRTPEHLERHPFGKVPVIEHEGQFLFESNAILRYLGSLDSNRLYPSQKMERALVDQWMEFYSNQPGRWATAYWYQKLIGPKFFNEAPDEKIIEQNLKMILEVMPVIDQRLGEKEFIAGERFTLADLVAQIGFMGAQEAQIPLSDFKNFSRWSTAVNARPAWKRTLEVCDLAAKKSV